VSPRPARPHAHPKACGALAATEIQSKEIRAAARHLIFVATSMDGDYLDIILEQWAAERPDLDVSPMGVIGRISRVSRVLERNIDRIFASFGLSRGGFDVLAALRRSGPPYRLSPTELYNSLLISSGAMTNRVDRLEDLQLVSRVPDPKDRRGVSVGLTPKGKRLVDKVIEAHLENEQRLLEHLGGGERDRLAELLRKLLIHVDDSRAHVAKDGARERRPVA
jgi:DNA-binding MarR family transcriptional regulator